MNSARLHIAGARDYSNLTFLHVRLFLGKGGLNSVSANLPKVTASLLSRLESQPVKISIITSLPVKKKPIHQKKTFTPNQNEMKLQIQCVEGQVAIFIICKQQKHLDQKYHNDNISTSFFRLIWNQEGTVRHTYILFRNN